MSTLLLKPSRRGDIRESSMDEDYPWTVEPTVVGSEATKWRAANLATGWMGPTRETYSRARCDLRYEREVARIRRELFGA